MSYGIVAYGTDNKIAFHSDYSSVVYAGQMSTTTSAVQPTYTAIIMSLLMQALDQVIMIWGILYNMTSL